MNIFNLALKSLKSFIQNNKVVFTILLASLVFSSMIFIYVIVKQQYVNAYLEDGLDLSYVTLENTSSLSAEEVSEKLNKYSSESKHELTIYAIANLRDSNNKIYDMITYPVSEMENLERLNKKDSVYIGSFFSQEDIVKGNNVCLLVSSFGESPKMFYADTKFEVIGSLNSYTDYDGVVTYKSLVNNNIVIEKYFIGFGSDISTGVGLKMYTDELTKLFPEFNVVNQLDIVASQMPETVTFENTAMTFMILLAILDVSYLYVFIIQKRMKNMLVYKLNGCTNFKLVLILMVELLIICLVQFLISVVLFRVVAVPYVVKYDLAFKYGLSIYHYLLSGAIMMILCLITLIPFMIYYCRVPVVRIREYIKD